MLIEWTEDLLVGIPEIDSQHEELVKRMNQLWNATSGKVADIEITDAIRFLEDYVLIHFDDEENLMNIHQDPGFDYHKEQHQEFIRKVGNLKAMLDQTGADYNLAILTLNAMFTWFLSHIRRTDRKLVKFG